MKIRVTRCGTIGRYGRLHYRYERFITVLPPKAWKRRTNHHERAHFKVDPQEWVYTHAGVSITRDHCMLSFMVGLRDAGHHVVVRPKWGGRFPFEEYTYGEIRNVECWYLGYLVGLGTVDSGSLGTDLWLSVAGRISRLVKQEHRYEALFQNACQAWYEYSSICQPHSWDLLNLPPVTI